VIRAGLIQFTSSDDPGDNLARVSALIETAAGQGADIVLTPEVTNCVSTSRSHQNAVLTTEEQDQTLTGLRDLAAKQGIWLLIGSLALKTRDPDGRFANRSFLIDPDGTVVARYDKIHMFDVNVTEAETFRESAGYRPGDKAVLAETPLAAIGLTVCYDMRFPALYRRLAQAGAQIITVPAAFSPVTGAAHWESLLRARAIETGAFILAPAQTGDHPLAHGRPRRTHGHSLAVAPWGEVLADAGAQEGVSMVDLDLSLVDDARRRVPSLTHDREFTGPKT